MSIAAIDDAGVTMVPESTAILVPWSAWRYGHTPTGDADESHLVSDEVGGYAFAIPVDAGAMAQRVHVAYRRHKRMTKADALAAVRAVAGERWHLNDKGEAMDVPLLIIGESASDPVPVQGTGLPPGVPVAG